MQQSISTQIMRIHRYSVRRLIGAVLVLGWIMAMGRPGSGC